MANTANPHFRGKLSRSSHAASYLLWHPTPALSYILTLKQCNFSAISDHFRAVSWKGKAKKSTKKRRCMQWPKVFSFFFLAQSKIFLSMDQRLRLALCRSQASLVSAGLKPIIRRWWFPLRESLFSPPSLYLLERDETEIARDAGQRNKAVWHSAHVQ